MNTIIRLEGVNKFSMCCDFCAVSQFEDGVFLIASPNGTHICQNCVTVCGNLIEDRGIDPHDLATPDAVDPEET